MKLTPLFTGLLAVLSLTMSASSMAALSMDKTRYIFEGNKDAISIVVKNAEKKTYGGQTWIENIKETDTRPTFVVTPPFFKITGDGKQVLRVIKALDEMPEDKESIYWVNLQEIPPVNKEGGLSVALRTKVKLLYRPANLVEGRKNAETGLSLISKGGKPVLMNTTPYIFAIADVLDAKEVPVALDDMTHKQLAMFAPGETVTLPVGSMAKSVVALDDLGYAGIHEIKGTGPVTNSTTP